MAVKISVIVPTHYRPAYLRKTVEALLSQDYPGKKYEIIIVGYKGDKSLGSVIGEFSGRGVNFFKIGSGAVDKKRNFGIKQARFGIVAFTDDDCVPEKNWLKNISITFEENPKIAGVEGLTWNDNKSLYCHAPQNLKGGNFLACNYAFKKPFLKKVGGFDENYRLNYREDTDLAFKLLVKGLKIKFCKDMRVYHPPIKIPLTAPLRVLKLIINDVLLFRKFPALSKKHFGMLCRGLVKQSLFTVFIFFLAGYSIYNNLFLLFASLIVVQFLFKYAIEMKGKQFSAFEGISFAFFSTLRDLLFGYVFLYLLLLRGKIRVLDNLFDRLIGFR